MKIQMILAIWIAVELVWFNVFELFLFFGKVIHASTKKINSNNIQKYTLLFSFHLFLY